MQIQSASNGLHSYYSLMRKGIDAQDAAGSKTAESAGLEAEASATAPEPEVTPEQSVSEASDAESVDQDLTDEELRQIQLLKQRDIEVRTHEQAHMSAGGQYVTGGASYSYQLGPDGKRYAIGGEVGIDTSMSGGDPAGNIVKARTIQRAALAPAKPSGQDHRVAAAARAMEIKAQVELSKLQEAGGDSTSPEQAISEGVERATSDTGSKEGRESQSGVDVQGAQARLDQRIRGFFAEPTGSRWSQVA